VVRILVPALTPHRHLVLAPADTPHSLPRDLSDRLESAFARGAGHGLLELGIREVGTALPPEFAYWRDFAARYVTALCTSDEAAGNIAVPPAPMLADLAAAAPPMPGGEYLDADVLADLWQQIDAACRAERTESHQSRPSF